VVVWLAVVAIEVVMGQIEARRGLDAVRQARAELSASDVVAARPVADLRRADHQFSAAHGHLASPVLWPLQFLPVLGRQLRSTQDLSASAAQVSRIGTRSIGTLQQVIDEPHTGGADRVATLGRLAALAGSTDAALGRVDLGPSAALIGPVARSHDEFARDLAQVRTTLRHATASSAALADILQGPQHYLVLLANNAEMRAGSGMYLQAAVAGTSNGELELGEALPTGSLAVPPGAVPTSGDLAANWGWLSPTVDWRNLNLTPRFNVTAPLAAQMWQQQTGQHVDGVVAVDVIALQAILQVTGPVTLDDGTVVDASNVVRYALHDQYEGLSDNAQAGQQEVRRDRLGSLAQATLTALQDRPLDLRSLASALSGVAAGRHVLVWSRDASAQADWRAAGVAGTVPVDGVMPAVLNTGGNKLDPYLSVTSSMRMVRSGSSTRGTLTVDLANHTPPGQPQYIAGPFPGLSAVYGEYLGLLSVTLPGTAFDVHVVSGPGPEVKGGDGPTWVIAVPIDVLQGHRARVVLGFTMPGTRGSLTVLPTARVPSVTWGVGSQHFTDASSHEVSW
jgi:Protein of unknown function (DUF4012)